jgi:NADH dehydrogenase (ubiquinone) Fe-S protein 1
MRIDINNQNQVKNLDNKLTLISYLINKGITIPHFCYHNDLPIAGNCRVCLVELKNSPKPVVSCGINAKSCLMNNKVYYDSVLLKKARENILEFLLLNHPVDCPICDQGGECDLQEQSLFFGFTKKRFYKFKRVVTDKDLGPIVKTVMTRCIHCTRCVRFATEIAGVEDLGVFGRGVGSEIGTYLDKIFLSELSGNVIDLCPVGKQTLKNYKSTKFCY